MKNILWFMILFSAGLLASCAEDKGNYDYKELNLIEIEGFKPLNENSGVYNVTQGSRLKITPDIKQSLEKDDDLSYLWLVNKDTIARTRDLDIIADMTFGKKTCCYIVIENKTGIRYYHRFEITVTSPYSMGYYILAEREDHSALISYLPTDTTGAQFVSTDKIGEIALGNSPAYAYCDFDYSNDRWKMSFMMQEGEYKMIQTNTENFMPTATLNEHSYIGDNPDGYKFNPNYLYSTMGGANFFVSNGQLVSLVEGVLYRPAKGDYNLAPWLTDLPYRDPYLTAFDQNQHRFIHLRPTVNDPANGIIGDPNTCDQVVEIEGSEIVSASEEFVGGSVAGQTTDVKVITRDATNLNFYTISYGDLSSAPKITKDNSIPLSGLNDKTQVVLAEKTWYILVGNTIYKSPMLLPAISTVKEIPSTLGEVQTFNLCTTNTRVIVATYNSQSPEAQKGSIYFLNAESGEIELPGYKNVTGKAASIICPEKSPW